MDRGTWWVTVHEVTMDLILVAKSWTRLSYKHTHSHPSKPWLLLKNNQSPNLGVNLSLWVL